jgi:hypothetical protein
MEDSEEIVLQTISSSFFNNLKKLPLKSLLKKLE